MGEKRVKFADAFWKSLLGVFLVDFWSIFHIFLVLSTRKNRVIYNVFVPVASKKKLLTTCRKLRKYQCFC